MAKSFEKLVELNVIDDTLSKRMIGAVEFRKLAVHSYEKINWDIVKSICEYHMQDFKYFTKMIAKQLD